MTEPGVRAVIAGGRDYQFGPNDIAWLDYAHQWLHISVVICGDARGADTCGAAWAQSRGIPVEHYPADWSKGRGAGHIRNKLMASKCDIVLLAPGGAGTASMRTEARLHNKRVFDFFSNL